MDYTANNNKALVRACKQGRVDDVKSLLSWRGVGKNDGKRVDPNIPFVSVCSSGNIDILNLLLKWKGVDGECVDFTNTRGIFLACVKGHTEIVQRLLKMVGKGRKRIDPTFENNVLLNTACKEGYTDIVQELLEWKGLRGARVDPTMNDNVALEFACANDRYDVVKLILSDARVDLTINDDEIFYIACKKSYDPYIIQELLTWVGRENFEGNCINPTGRHNKAIRIASSLQKDDMVKVLIRFKSIREALVGNIQGDEEDEEDDDDEHVDILNYTRIIFNGELDLYRDILNNMVIDTMRRWKAEKNIPFEVFLKVLTFSNEFYSEVVETSMSDCRTSGEKKWEDAIKLVHTIVRQRVKHTPQESSSDRPHIRRRKR